MSYAKGIPIDKNRTPMQAAPAPALSNARYASENASASSVITLNDNTSQIEIAAIGANRAGIMRWVTTSDTQASVTATNFDHAIPTENVRTFVVPKESAGTHSVVGVNIKEGLYRRVAIMSMGPASILLSEF